MNITLRTFIVLVILPIVGAIILFVIAAILPSNETRDDSQNPPPASIPNELTVSVFFANNDFISEETPCSSVTPVSRIIKTDALARNVAEVLLRGPTEEEGIQGFYSHIPSQARLQNIQIENSTLVADFSQELEQNASRCKTEGIQAQLTQTLLQFPNITKLIISINGRTDNAFNKNL